MRLANLIVTPYVPIIPHIQIIGGDHLYKVEDPCFFLDFSGLKVRNAI
jgi:hypothetical protein